MMTRAEILDALERNDLPDDCVEYSASEIAQAAKKSWGKIVDMIVPVEIGRCEVKQVKAEDLEHVISLGLKA